MTIEMLKAIEEQLKEKGEIRKDDRIRLLDVDRAYYYSEYVDVIVDVIREGDWQPYGVWELKFDPVRKVICWERSKWSYIRGREEDDYDLYL